MALSKYGVAYLAASFLTSQRQVEVAADYVDWIDEQASEDLAMDALLAAARSSKSPDKVLAAADGFYVSIVAVDTADNPSITTITPSSGIAAGGVAGTIVGTDLTGTTGITFGGVAATSVVVVDDTHVTYVTPAHAAGAVNVVLTAIAGVVTATNGYTYV